MIASKGLHRHPAREVTPLVADARKDLHLGGLLFTKNVKSSSMR